MKCRFWSLSYDINKNKAAYLVTMLLVHFGQQEKRVYMYWDTQVLP